MTSPSTDTDLPVAVAKHQEAIEQLTAVIELHQQQIEALWRRIQDLEGVPFPDVEPPS
jgi:hypothetical protein